MIERGRELAAAFGLLTRLPVWRIVAEMPANHARAVWAYPAAGAVVGAIGGGAFWLASQAFAPTLASVWAVACVVLATGALHEDGLADTADGFGGGRTPERKREIMRDSRIGTFGALALILAVALRVAALAAMGSPSHALAAIVVAHTLARGAIIVGLLAAPPARTDGLAAGLGQVPTAEASAGLVHAGLVAVLVLAPGHAALVLGLAVAIALGMARLARAQIGGHTGDVLGAIALLTEVAILSALVP